MDRLTLAVLACWAVLAAAGPALAEEAAVAPAAGTLEADLPPALFARVVKPIEVKVAEAEKVVAIIEKEQQKDAAKQNQALILASKDKAATLYQQAAHTAEQNSRLLKEDTHKAMLKAQYEDPNKQKAIALLLELATDAEQKRDIRRAVACYQRILAIDRENPSAREALVRIEKDLKAAQKAAEPKKKSDDDKPKPWDTRQDRRNW